MEGALFETSLGKSECPALLSAPAQGAAYQAQVMAKGKGHAPGPPQIWVFGGLLDAPVKQGDKVEAQTAVDPKKCLSEYSGTTVESKCELERLFSSTAQFRSLVHLAQQQLGWTRRFGRVPPLHLACELQEWLEGLMKQ